MTKVWAQTAVTFFFTLTPRFVHLLKKGGSLHHFSRLSRIAALTKQCVLVSSSWHRAEALKGTRPEPYKLCPGVEYSPPGAHWLACVRNQIVSAITLAVVGFKKKCSCFWAHSEKLNINWPKNNGELDYHS